MKQYPHILQIILYHLEKYNKSNTLQEVNEKLVLLTLQILWLLCVRTVLMLKIFTFCKQNLFSCLWV